MWGHCHGHVHAFMPSTLSTFNLCYSLTKNKSVFIYIPNTRPIFTSGWSLSSFRSTKCVFLFSLSLETLCYINLSVCLCFKIKPIFYENRTLIYLCVLKCKSRANQTGPYGPTQLALYGQSC